MTSHDGELPRLRPVEVIPNATEDGRVLLRDPSGLAAGMLAVGPPALTILALMDGCHRRIDAQAAFMHRFGQMLFVEELDALVDQLDRAGYLEGPSFESYYAGLVEEYRAAPYRPLRDPNGFGTPVDALGAHLDEILQAPSAQRSALGAWRSAGTGPAFAGPSAKHQAPSAGALRLLGLIAPHLDYARGRPCYGASYRLLRGGPHPERVVILGTNHFGRSGAVVATRKAFDTPFGMAPNDPEFLERLEAACGGDLFPSELDHLREHSVELQVVWLRHLLGEGCRIVPFLCPDPCGPTGTAPRDGRGVDLRGFAEALGRLLRDDSVPTLLVASADLSHVGGYFGDTRSLETAYLESVAAGDDDALRHVDAGDAEGFRTHMTATGNPTRVCSVGCIYALMTALGAEARPVRLGYHQAVTAEIDNAVTCAAYAFYE
jgi:AmmeMemoRadiSam system protein B